MDTNNDKWPPSLVAHLRELWATGLSTRKIGKALGVTGAAVSGKARRLDLPKRGSPIKYNHPRKPNYRRVAVDKRKSPEYAAKMSAITKAAMARDGVKERIGAASSIRNKGNQHAKAKKSDMRRIIFDDVLTAALIDLRVNKKLPWTEIVIKMGISDKRIRAEARALRAKGIDI